MRGIGRWGAVTEMIRLSSTRQHPRQRPGPRQAPNCRIDPAACAIAMRRGIMVFEWLRPFTQVPNREISAALRFAVDVHETGGPNSERRRALERRRMAFFADRIDGRAILGRARASIDGGRAAIVGMVIGFASLAAGGAARAQDLPATGQPKPWQLGFQPPATPVMEDIENFHGNLVLPIVIVVALFVLALLLVVIFRFNSKANPVPSKLTHHTGLEIAWTVLPILILVVIAIPSFRLLYFQQVIPKAGHHHQGDRHAVVLVLRVSGQWRHRLRCQHGRRGRSQAGAAAPSRHRQRGRRAGRQERPRPGHRRRRDPFLHHARPSASRSMPFRAASTRPGSRPSAKASIYGQCSELCGIKHAFMPIAVRVVSDADFASLGHDQEGRDATARTPNKVAAATSQLIAA